MEGILIFIGGVVLFIGMTWFWGEVIRPLRQLQRLIGELSEGKKPKGLWPEGRGDWRSRSGSWSVWRRGWRE